MVVPPFSHSRAALLAAIAAVATFGSPQPSAAGLGGLTPVEFSQLSGQDLSPFAAKALAIHPSDWQHAETEHFIYHYQNSFVATPVSVEAEFHFRFLMTELRRPPGDWNAKAHIYIFERPEDWQAFQSAGQLEPWTGGIQSGGSLFIVRNPAYRFTDNSLGHEVVHLVLRRLYGIGIPLWLNEGFAQYVSKRAYVSYQRARNYNAKPWSNGIAREKYVPLATLTRMSYPPAEEVETFYDESERLVRFLVSLDKPKFMDFLAISARGDAFDTALANAFGGTAPSTAAIEETFRSYASKDAGAAPEQ